MSRAVATGAFAALLADAFRGVLAANIELDGASNHGVSDALHLGDYNQNGVELCWGRPREPWRLDACASVCRPCWQK